MESIYNVDNWYNYYSDSQNITLKANALIKKSRKMRSDIKKMNLGNANSKQIFSNIIDDTYEFNNFHNMCILGQIICDDVGDCDRWSSIDMLLNAYIEEFNTDNEIFVVLEKIKTNYWGLFDEDEQSAFDIILSTFHDYGGNLKESNKQFVDMSNVLNKIDKHINTIFCHIHNGNVVDFSSIEEIDELQNEPEIKKLFVSKNNIRINKKIHEDIIYNTGIKRSAKLYLSSLYGRYIADIYPVLFELFLLRAKLAKLNGFENYSEYSIRKCINSNHDVNFDTIKKMIIALDDDVNTEINSVSSSNVSRSIAQTKHSLIKRINLMKKNSINDIIEITINLISSIYRLQFISNNKCKKWSNNVLIFDVFDKSNDKLLGHIFIDMNLKKVHKICCVELLTCAEYPYGSNNITLPIACITGNHNNIMSYYDVILFAREISNAIHCLCGKSKVNVLNGMACAADYDNFIGTMIEQYMWEQSTILKYTKNNVTDANMIKKLNTIDSALSLKRKCVYALFDNFIYSSDQFLKLCIKLTKEKDFVKLIDMFNKFYNSIVSQVLVDNKTSHDTHDSVILSCINDNSGNKCSILMTEITAKNFYSKNKSDELFFMIRMYVMNSYGKNMKQKLNLITEHVKNNMFNIETTKELKIIKNKSKNNLLFVKNK